MMKFKPQAEVQSPSLPGSCVACQSKERSVTSANLPVTVPHLFSSDPFSGLTLGIRDLDQVIISTASAAQQPFLFLCGCHHRIVHLIRNHRPNKEDDSYKLNALGEIRRMSVDFCIHALLEPDIFEYDRSICAPSPPPLFSVSTVAKKTIS